MTRQVRHRLRLLRAGRCTRCGRRRSVLYAEVCRRCAVERRRDARARVAARRGVPTYRGHEESGLGRPPFVPEPRT